MIDHKITVLLASVQLYSRLVLSYKKTLNP